jgi:predicted NUDIX family NTP pyrophosphohydrolase
MAKNSAGLLLYKISNNKLFFFLVHPGGPFWAKKDMGSWSIPKGEFESEDAFSAAKREFHEETSFTAEGNFIELTPLKQKSGKMIYAWGVEAEIDVGKVKSNLFELEWPPKSGKLQTFPEVDKGQWFLYFEAKNRIVQGQIGFIDELVKKANLTVGNDESSTPSQLSIF